jgi:hypothetical protein
MTKRKKMERKKLRWVVLEETIQTQKALINGLILKVAMVETTTKMNQEIQQTSLAQSYQSSRK